MHLLRFNPENKTLREVPPSEFAADPACRYFYVQGKRAADLLQRLAEWKASALAVERNWDANGIATMLGCQLGESQRACIQREVPRLLDRLRELEHPHPVAVNERLPKAGEWVWHCYAGVRFWQHGIYNGRQFFIGDGPESQPATHWRPADALPLPTAEATNA